MLFSVSQQSAVPEPDIQPSYSPVAHQRGWSSDSNREHVDDNDNEQLIDNDEEAMKQEPYMRASKAVSMGNASTCDYSRPYVLAVKYSFVDWISIWQETRQNYDPNCRLEISHCLRAFEKFHSPSFVADCLTVVIFFFRVLIFLIY